MSDIESYTASEWLQAARGIEKDAVAVLLENGKSYTAKEVEALVKKFKAKGVKSDGGWNLDNAE